MAGYLASNPHHGSLGQDSEESGEEEDEENEAMDVWPHVEEEEEDPAEYQGVGSD